MSAPAPCVAMLLIGYNQERTIGEAIDAALAQTYSPLEIVISDDASSDGTYAAMQRRIAGYRGPHRVILNRNPRNLGIGAHLSHAASLCSGELLFVAAGDDISLPERCSRVVEVWQRGGQRADLIASSVKDIDAHGVVRSTITPSDLGRYRTLADWAAAPPQVTGAAQAWTRRLLNRFGPLPEGVMGEDVIMAFRAIASGGAVSIAEPLVHYRRGGISRRVRARHASDVVARLRTHNRYALVELPLLLADARSLGQFDVVEPLLGPWLARERFIDALFAAENRGRRLQLALRTRNVPWPLRLRMASYAVCPELLAPWFWIKRLIAPVGKEAE